MSEKTSKKQPDAGTASDAETVPQADLVSELNESRWSVVTFEECVARGMTYDAAFRKMQELADAKQFGLCILTDEAAARISKRKKR